MSERGRCETCRFWSDWSDDLSRDDLRDGYGECRRHPPVRLQSLELIMRRYDAGSESIGHVEETKGAWPVTDGEQWCGEFQPKEGGS